MFAARTRTGIDWTPFDASGCARTPEPVEASGAVGGGGMRAAIRARGGGGSGVRGGGGRGVRGGGRCGCDGTIARVTVVGRISGTGSDSGTVDGGGTEGGGTEGGGGIELDRGIGATGVASSS